MNLHAWAQRWGVPYAALHELAQHFGQLDNDPPPVAGKSEGAVQTLVRLEATRKGKRLFRNNVGAGYLQDGSFIRWGLANDSKAVNDVCKSSDLIGISPEIITAADVGYPRGRFVAREIKEAGWQYTGTEREVAQYKFLCLIASMGGDARFATGEGTL
jgi:hypothetical protein